MINSRNIEDLAQPVAAVCRDHISRCHLIGIELLVTSTWRDCEAQEVLFATGRTVDKDRKPVTNARGGQSWHNFRCAYDVVAVINGKAIWDRDDPTWQRIVIMGRHAGAEAGADWKEFPDLPHFQVRPKAEDGAPIDFAEAVIRLQRTRDVFRV